MHDKSMYLQKQVVSRLKQLSPKDSPDIMSAIQGLARTFRDLGQYEKALELQNEAMDIRSRNSLIQSSGGRRDTQDQIVEGSLTLKVLSDLVTIQCEKGDYKGAQISYQTILLTK